MQSTIVAVVMRFSLLKRQTPIRQAPNKIEHIHIYQAVQKKEKKNSGEKELRTNTYIRSLEAESSDTTIFRNLSEDRSELFRRSGLGRSGTPSSPPSKRRRHLGQFLLSGIARSSAAANFLAPLLSSTGNCWYPQKGTN